MENLIKVRIGEEEKTYPYETKYYDIVTEYQKGQEDDIVLVMVNNKLQELHKTLKEDCNLTFVTTRDPLGFNAYKRSVTFMFLKAVYDVMEHKNLDEVKVLYSIGKGYFCKINGNFDLNEEFLEKVKARMSEMVDMKMPIKKRTINTDDAMKIFHKHGMYDKEKLFRYRRVSKINLYSLNEFEDYYYGYMVPHTGYLKYFDLMLYDDGVILQLPGRNEPKKVAEFRPQPKLFQIQKESTRWGDMMEIDTVGALNDRITEEGMNKLILVQEALQEKKIAEIAETICLEKNKKFIMIAGPSSSGKTTFSHRLSIQLLAHGMKPHPIAVDNYFVERHLTPIDEFGEYDYESLAAIDIELFNQNMNDLLLGKEVDLPVYNFKTGKREYKQNYTKLGTNDILVIEGIHCLNDQLSYSLPKESKFKIYISALTQLNIDEHNRIPTTDGRLIRRLVRDARTRGTSARKTISMWPSVRRGEEKNIFPFQEDADVMFNSALIYELAILKQYAEPILFGIRADEPEFIEAKRLLKFLDYFVGVPTEAIPKNSILREFIGGSCFHV